MMELEGEDGCIVELSETLKKELGRGPGIAPHDRSVSRRQVCLQVQQISSHSVVIEVIGPNPICVLHANVGDLEVEIVKPGTQSSLKIGDKFSLSIQEPVFYTLRRPQLSRHESTDRGKLLKDAEQGVDEEKGIAEAVARWQRRKQERLQSDLRRPLTVEGGAQQAQDGSQQELVYNQAVSQEANEPEQIGRPTTNEDDADLAKKYGFIVEGSEFERYGKKGLDTSKWDWQIGRQPGSDDDDEEEGGERLQQNRTAPGPSTKRKAKPRSEDDDDDWRGDSDGEKELLSARKRPVPRKKDVQTRSQNLATSLETILDPRKKRKMVSTSDVEHPSIDKKDSKTSKQRTASTSTKKTSKRKPRASESEEGEDDDDGEDLDGFLVDDTEEEEEEEEEEEVADEEDEWTDEDDAIEDDDELEEEPARAHAPGRPVVDKGDGDDVKPLCKYGNKCFRKNKDHLAQFRH